jgi:OmpA-OmpF porin, OOP family
MSVFGGRGAWMGSRTMGVMVLAAGLATASAAQAQPSALPEPNTFDLTPFIGFGFGYSDGFDVSDGTFLLGVAGAYNFTTQLAVEGELGIIPDIAGDTPDLDISVQTFSANGVYHFDTRSAVVPYATLGLGFGRIGVDSTSGDDSNTEFAFNLGGGVKYPINDRLAVRGDVRYFNVNDLNPNFWRIYGGVTFRLGQR